MKLIESRENPAFKHLLKIDGGTRRHEQVLLDGVHLCESWLALHGQPDQMIVDHARMDRPDIAALVMQVDDHRGIALAPTLMARLIEVQSGQGIAFLVTPPAPMLPAAVTTTSVLLDRIQDPGNLGTLLRSCAAAGVSEVFLATGCAHAWSPKVLRSGQGAHFALNLYERVDPSALLDRVSLPVVATALDGADDLYRTTLPNACLWIFGHEGQGVSPELLARADWRVKIEQAANVESLNVAMAATLCLFEQRRRARRD